MPEGSPDTAFRHDTVKPVIAGAVAGLVSRFCTAPLDVVKIRLQLQQRHNNVPAAQGIYPLRTREAICTIWQHEGLRAFWKGNVPAELLYVAYGMAQFGSYGLLRKAMEQTPWYPGAQAFIAGAGAGAAATFVTYPLDLLRTRFAARSSRATIVSLRRDILDIYCDQGLSGYFRGVQITIGQIVPYMGLFFSTYEILEPLRWHLKLPYGAEDAARGIIAGLAAKTSLFPLDLIKKRLQVQYTQPPDTWMRPFGSSAMTLAKDIVAREGLRGLYHGLTISLLKSAPASAITMWVYERTLHILKTQDSDGYCSPDRK